MGEAGNCRPRVARSKPGLPAPAESSGPGPPPVPSWAQLPGHRRRRLVAVLSALVQQERTRREGADERAEQQALGASGMGPELHPSQGVVRVALPRGACKEPF